MRGVQILVSLLLLAVLCNGDKSTEEKMEEIRNMLKECSDKQGLTKEETEVIPRKMCAGEKLDKKLSCHAACFYKKLGVMKDGEFVTDEVKNSILSHMKDEDKKKEVEGKLEQCKSQVTAVTDECDKAVEFTKCLLVGTEHCEKW